MVLQSPVFWTLLMVSTLVYWSLPRKWADGFLAAVSYGYLASLEPVVVTVLIGWTLSFFYLAPHAIATKQGRAVGVWLLILAILSYLAYYKYLPVVLYQFSAWEWLPGVLHSPIVPLGISYFTFKLIHYAIEVVRGNITDRSLSRFFCYIFLYPIFSAGPIERFDHFLANRENSWRLESAIEGLTRIIHGLIKMFVFGRLLLGQVIQPRIADGKMTTVLDVMSGLEGLSALEVWLYLAVAFLYAYLEFSAYSDIAIGASRLYGFRIMENFNVPIVAANIGDFWKRWHMSLAGWCQSYVYLPVIGLTRQPYIAVYCTFLAMGVWHGAAWNWILWGVYHATGVSIYLTWARIKRRLQWHQIRPGRWRYAGVPLTFAFVTGSYAFSTTIGWGGWNALRVFAKLAGINLGANPLG